MTSLSSHPFLILIRKGQVLLRLPQKLFDSVHVFFHFIDPFLKFRLLHGFWSIDIINEKIITRRGTNHQFSITSMNFACLNFFPKLIRKYFVFLREFTSFFNQFSFSHIIIPFDGVFLLTLSLYYHL